MSPVGAGLVPARSNGRVQDPPLQRSCQIRCYTKRLTSPFPEIFSTQRVHNVGCSFTSPTSSRRCQHRSHFSCDDGLISSKILFDAKGIAFSVLSARFLILAEEVNKIKRNSSPKTFNFF